ncbi:rhodanese-like domain-containing protein [Synoicihabitans lomoniglobus]|uniref:Rhodanese-like domain-containing protein n=1 Tax=Synoicihabitans lomoniglobus TaxID=2909285 RepID=A0AAE9ZWW0_9BACT|nr:rhodanese-like domain-containing protein [Opitutaceae bacterium LMO-M01]WED64916.1 rhodanese-like domain-containing protein [Opitutaceae bacterium LMO-M01]
MKILALIALAFVFLAVVRTAFGQGGGPRIEPTEAAAKVRAGEAILIDVREPAEWSEGVAAPAYLLPLSDLRGARKKWSHVLATAKKENKQVLLYCRSGNRSGQAANILAKEGFDVANVGGFRDWNRANLPLRAPDEPAGNE